MVFTIVDNYHMHTIFFLILFFNAWFPQYDEFCLFSLYIKTNLKTFELEIKSAFYPLKRYTIESGELCYDSCHVNWQLALRTLDTAHMPAWPNLMLSLEGAF